MIVDFIFKSGEWVFSGIWAFIRLNTVCYRHIRSKVFPIAPVMNKSRCIFFYLFDN